MTKNEAIRLVLCTLVAVIGTYFATAAQFRGRQKDTDGAAIERPAPVSPKPEVKAEAAVAESAPALRADAKQVFYLKQTPEVLAMKPCQAKLVSKNPCTATFDLGKGQELQLGGPFTSRPIFSFVRTLEDGATYAMPEAFIQFLDKGNWKSDPDAKPKNYVDEKF